MVQYMNRTLLEKIQCILSNVRLDKKFWAKIAGYTSHLINQLPSTTIGGKTFMKIWYGKHAQDYNTIRVFWCPAYYQVKNDKLDPHARKTIFVGIKSRVKSFKLWDLEDKTLVYSKDITFDETSILNASSFQ